MKKSIIFFLSLLSILIFITGCNSTDNDYNNGDYSNSQASDTSSESAGQAGNLADSGTMALAAQNGEFTIDNDAFGMGGMSSMGDIETLMKGNEPMPKDYKPRFLLVGEVNITVMTGDGNSTFYHLASVYDDQYSADDYVPKSQFKILDDEKMMEVRIVGAPVWQDKLVQNFYMTIKFKVPLPVAMDGPDGVNREYIPMGQYHTVFYPHNMQNMVQTGGQEYYWGYLMGGGGYYFVAERNETIQFAFGAFILPE